MAIGVGTKVAFKNVFGACFDEMGSDDPVLGGVVEIDVSNRGHWGRCKSGV